MSRSPVWQFGDFQLHKISGELTRSGVRVPLERQPALVLICLIEARGEIVTRETLRQAVWGDQTHVAFDDSLNYCIRRIRAALGDDPKRPIFVETLPRRGYRFIADAKDVISSPVRRLPAWAAAAAAIGAAIL